MAVLESDASLEEKAIACRKLGEFGTPEAVPALARLLGPTAPAGGVTISLPATAMSAS